MKLEVKGIEEVKAAFRQLPKEIARKALRGALMDGAEVIRREARVLAPRRSGKLAKSIIRRARTRPRAGDMTVSVGADRRAWYWHFVEFGHRLVRGRGKRNKRVVGQVRSRSYLRAAFDRRGADAAKRVMQRLGPQIEAIARRLRRQVAKRGL